MKIVFLQKNIKKEKMYKPEILPYALPDDNEIGIEQMTITYCQVDDTNHRTQDGDDQHLTISTESAICNKEEALKGEGYYLTIKTDRWALDPDEGIDFLLKDFMSRLNPKMPKNNEADAVEKDV